MQKKGFGQSEPRKRDARKFIEAFRKYISETKGDKEQLKQFLRAKSAKLNESLLEALPSVFKTLTANQSSKKREAIANVVGTLGNLIQELSHGDRPLNLELSLTAYQLALEIFTYQEFPKEWATTQNNLGVVYGKRIRGKQEENLELAIVAYEQALQVYTRDAFPEDWASMQNNLANAYRERIRGERAENLELAIVAYEQALQVYTRDAFPEQWAGTQNNLGNAYCERIRGERAENLECALATYEQALQVYTRDAFPEDWAKTKHNLANAYRDRVTGEEAKNLEQALKFYKEASEVFTREAHPYKWVENQSNLAEALMKRASLNNNTSDLETAIIFLQKALEVSASGSPEFIDSQYRLGNALSRRYEHSQNPDDLQSALKAYKTALDAISVEHYDRKQIWQALPTTQSILGSRLIRDGQWQEGLQYLLNSVHQLSIGDDSLAHANALFQTGRAQEILLNKDEARLYYRDALRLYQHLQDSLGIAKSRYGLGSVFVSRGNLKKGMTELMEARKIYEELGNLDKVADIDDLYRDAEQVMEEQQALEEVYL